METQQAVEKAGGIRKLAELFGITSQAVYAWGEDVPLLRVYQLREMKPEWFPAEEPVERSAA